MLSNRLISFNKKLSNEFIHYIESTNKLCIYKLGTHYIPSCISFPNADTIAFINCSKSGISNILHPNIFPNVKHIHYLSADPGDYLIFNRFQNDIEWVFPNKTYAFYDHMVSSGRGKKDDALIKQYVANKRIIDGENGFDISFQFDIHVPNFGITDGDWWRYQFYEYLVSKQHEYIALPKTQEEEERILQQEIVDKVLN